MAASLAASCSCAGSTIAMGSTRHQLRYAIIITQTAKGHSSGTEFDATVELLRPHPPHRPEKFSGGTFMKFRTSNHFLGILVVGLLFVLGASTNAMGQGRGHGNSHWNKKCEKFVNCHDARDGRRDGRGPNRRTGFNNNFRRYRRYRDN